MPSLGGVFNVVTEPVECAEAEGNAGLRVGGLLVAMVGLKVTLRAGRAGLLGKSGVDSDCVAMMKIMRMCLVRTRWRYGQMSTHAFLLQYECSRVTELASKPRHNRLGRPKPFPRGWAQLPSFPQSLNTSLSVRALYVYSLHVLTVLTTWN